jgi:glycosyltransferase involved in cell wall biosynthesis
MDLWPELIVRKAPPQFQWLADLAFSPVYAARKRTYGRLSAVTALARPYLDAVFEGAPMLINRPNAVVYNGIDVHGFRRALADQCEWPSRFPVKRDDDIWAVFAGSLGPSYDIGTMCAVAESLAAERSNIRIVIAGDGPERGRVEAAAGDLATGSNIFYLGQLAPNDLAALYSRCDIGL